MAKGSYYVPEQSKWPIIGAVALFLTVLGGVNWLHGKAIGPYIFALGTLLILYMIFGWFKDVIQESQAGLYSAQMDRSFRLGMLWFIFTEVVFFLTLFATLFYIRVFSVPWLSGEGTGALTHLLLWPSFQGGWPLLHTPDPAQFLGPKVVEHAWGTPAFGTLLLLTSAVMITYSQWSLLRSRQTSMNVFLLITIILGATFLGLQMNEFNQAVKAGLTMSSGIFGSTYYMITGFHSIHILVGLIMLTVIFIRSLKGHFSPDNHFAFSAVAWYWHFINVTWLATFIFVYWI